MTKLFGVPLGPLSLAFAASLAIAIGLVAALALRNRVLFRLGIRNMGRRRGRSALIVVGLMLGTAIIAAALATGDTMSHTIRASSVKSLGYADEVVQARGAKPTLAVSDSGAATGVQYFPATDYNRIAAELSRSPLVDGVAPAIIEPVAAVDLRTRQNEPQMTLFATDPTRMRGFGTIRARDGRPLSLSQLGADEVFLNVKSAQQLDARPGDAVKVLAGDSMVSARVRAIVRYDGTGTSKSALVLPLASAQRLLGQPGQLNKVLISNRGDELSGAGLTTRVTRLLRPTLASLGLDVSTAKRDAIKDADATGAAFMSFFTTFGSFSIAAGILLIFLIFVMLAAERRGELGIARAVGTRRSHLVEMFVFEGFAYDLAAAALGVVLGMAVAYGMVLLMAGAFSSTGDIHVSYSVKPASLIVAYTIGMLITFAVVAFSAWRVSRMNIVTAIRDLPEPPAHKHRRRSFLVASGGIALGILMIASGVSSKSELPFSAGVSCVILSLASLARSLGVSDRLARSGAGVALLAWFVLPANRWVLGPHTKSDFSIFIFSGLMVVIGATWTIMYNAEALLGTLNATLGRSRRIAPVLKMSIAYPMRSLFRTGVTFAMFTLVVFTLVVGATISGAFTNAFNDMKSFGGGFDVRATTAPASPIADMTIALHQARGIRPGDFRLVSSQSFLPVRARQVGTGHAAADYVVRGLDPAFLEHTTYGMAATANGFRSAAEVWRAVREQPGLAVIDASIAPRRANFGFAPQPKLRLSGFYLDDKHFSPFGIDVRDSQTGRHLRLTVVGVLPETAPFEMAGILTAQEALNPIFLDRVQPSVYLFSLRPGVDPRRTAKALQSAFIAHGMHADALSKLLSDAVGTNRVFNLLVEGFMGLGLIVGVAALGVISARAVVERRQQIGVLRAIGFRKRMVQLSFLLESSFIALSSIVIGTALGLAVAYNFLHDAQQQPSWGNLSFSPPWLALVIIFVAVYAIAMATTYAPSIRASRVYPAEALRYQ